MKSTLLTMTASLCGLSLVVGAALAGVNILTEKPIAEAQAAARRQAIAEVLPQFDNNPAEEAFEQDGLTLFPAEMAGSEVGMAVETYSAWTNGFLRNVLPTMSSVIVSLSVFVLMAEISMQ